MIHFYGLAYRIPEYVKKATQSILNNASEEFSFTLLVNPCGDKRDQEIVSYGRDLVERGSINRVIVFNKNIVGRANKVAVDLFPPDKSEEFFVVHDLSKVVPDCDWIQDIRNGLKENCLYGFDLDISNRAPWSAYTREVNGIGLWMLSVNTKIYRTYYKSESFIDSILCNTFKRQGWPIKKSKHKLYHQVWDVKNIDPDYWSTKARGRVNWACTDKADIIIYEKGKDAQTRTGC